MNENIEIFESPEIPVVPLIIIIEGASTLLTFPSECVGCGRLIDGECVMYRGQESRQHTRLGGCAGRTHGIIMEESSLGGTVSFDPLKASKKAAKGLAKKSKAEKKSKKKERTDSR